MNVHGTVVGKELPFSPDQWAQLLGLFGGVLVFMILLGVDIARARKKRAHWFPGHALVLTALTIQVMNLLNDDTALLKEVLDYRQQLYGELVKNNLYAIHGSRVMLCMIVAYLLPGLARPGYEDSWGKLMALGPTTFVHIFSELFTVYHRLAHSGLPLITYHFFVWPHAKEITQYSFIVSSAIISITLVWLLLLLSCALIANKSIRDIIAQKIPIILANQSITSENSSKAVADQVFKSWIVSRACYPESIIARSVLTTTATIAVTVCCIFSIAGWIIQGPVIYPYPCIKCRLKFITAVMQVIFSIIVWVILGWRGLTSIAYYGRWQSGNPNKSWRNNFQVEDFWTRYILELEEAAARKQKSKVDESLNKMIGSEGIEMRFIETLLRCVLRCGLRCVYWLQFLLVLSCKLCWLIAEFVLDNRFLQRISSKFLAKQGETEDKAFSEYEAILGNVDLLWGAPRTVFVTNRSSIEQAKKLMEEGEMNGRKCEALISFLTANRKSTGCVDARYLDPAKLQNKAGLKFLWKRDPGPVLPVEKHYEYASKPSLKLTAVSLINIILRLSPDCGKNALKAYSEACELVDMVDDADPATDSLLSKAADSVFKTLQDQTAEIGPYTTTSVVYMEDAGSIKTKTSVVYIEDAGSIIKRLAEESMRKVKVIEDGGDSLDWKKAGAVNALCKLCNSINCGSTENIMDLVNELQSVLADIIGGCIESVGGTLMDNCTKWAQDFQEGKLLKAVYIAGKYKTLMEQLGLSPNLQIEQPRGLCPNLHLGPRTTDSSMVTRSNCEVIVE